jgi:pimeloyl-ACP methyl ester carboxylesterase
MNNRIGRNLRFLNWRAFPLLASLIAIPEHGTAQSVDERLEDEWYLPVSDGCRLYVRELGRGPDTVVVLHGGFGADHSYLLPGFRPLLDRFHFVFYDQRASLRSPCPDSTATVAAHADDLERLRAALGLERMKLAGHSMGSFLAMTYLQRHPSRVSNLALLGALAPHTPTDAVDSGLVTASQQAFAKWRQRPEVAATKVKAGLPLTGDLPPKLAIRRWRIDFTGANVFHVDRWKQMAGGQVFYNPRAGSAGSRSMPRAFDFRTALASHPCTVTVIIGDHDLVDMGAARHRRWTTVAPSVALVVVRNTGHILWIDAPNEFAEALDRALSSKAPQCN